MVHHFHMLYASICCSTSLKTNSPSVSANIALYIHRLQLFAPSDVETACCPNTEFQSSMEVRKLCHSFHSTYQVSFDTIPIKPTYAGSASNCRSEGAVYTTAVEGVLTFLAISARRISLVQYILYIGRR
jgi:hypothetical protein